MVFCKLTIDTLAITTGHRKWGIRSASNQRSNINTDEECAGKEITENFNEKDLKRGVFYMLGKKPFLLDLLVLSQILNTISYIKSIFNQFLINNP